MAVRCSPSALPSVALDTGDMGLVEVVQVAVSQAIIVVLSR